MSLINSCQTGKVIRYNRRRGFGIMKHHGRTIIFHIRNYCEVEISNGHKHDSTKFGARTKSERLPEKGDRICFRGSSRTDRKTSEKRPCASAWYFKEDLTKKITSRKQNKQLGRKNRSRRRRQRRNDTRCYA